MFCSSLVRLNVIWMYFLIAGSYCTLLSEQLLKIQQQINVAQMASEIWWSKYGSTVINTNKIAKRQISNSSFSTQKVRFKQLQISKQMQLGCELHIQQDAEYFVFQTPRSAYVIVNDKSRHSFSIYHSNCNQLTTVWKHNVVQTYCDRGLCDDGSIVFLTDSNYLVSCSESRNFTDCSELVSVRSLFEKGNIVGGAVRGKGNNNMQTYLAVSEGQIIVLDQKGKHKLTVSLQIDSQIIQLVDIHPFPLLITSRGWIYVFDNNKYTISLSKCPYLHQSISRVIVNHPYESSLYAISDQIVTKVEYKNNNKACEVISRSYFSNSSLDSLGLSNVAEYNGQLYIGNLILDVRQQKITKLDQCNDQTSFNFQLMKNNYRKGIFTMKCPTDSNSKLRIFRLKDESQSSSKNNTVIMIVILFLIVLLIFLFLRSTTPNLDYDEQLKYGSNSDYKQEVDNYLQRKANANKQKKMNPKPETKGQ